MTSMTLKMRTMMFLAFCAAASLLNVGSLRQLAAFSLKSEYATYILIIPLTSVVLILRKRTAIFSHLSNSMGIGGSSLILGAVVLISRKPAGIGLSGEEAMSFTILGLILLWIGGFLLAYGVESFKKALFPLLLLFFMIPIPEVVLKSTIAFLQRGSAEWSAILFKLTGTPFHRDGMTFILPRISIEVAEQCSGIRSSLALLLSGLLATHLMLRTWWRKLLFLLVVVPIAMLKNAVRIVVLSLLSIHVDRRFIVSSDLHREGGILFFLLALLMLWPIFWLLRRSERKPIPTAESRSGSL